MYALARMNDLVDQTANSRNSAGIQVSRTHRRVQGTPPDGGRLDCLGCDLWEFRGGKVLKKDTYYKQAIR